MPIQLTRDVKIGSRNDDVKALYEALIAAGFPVEDTFGRFGRKTKKL